MTITNKYGLPEPLVRAITKHTHRGAKYSATQLLKSPRQLALERRYDDQIVVDANERIWSLLGSALHNVVEQGEGDHQFAEVYMEEEIAGVTVSGTADLYDSEDKTITDYKSTSVYTIIYNSREEEWEQQLNIYAWLLRRAGFQVNGGRIVAILRDWQQTKAQFDKDYPQSQVVVVPIRMWMPDEAEWFVGSRVRMHEDAEKAADSELPYCTDSERWMTSTKWAVMKNGRKSAVRVFDDPFSADKVKNEGGPNHYIEVRKGSPRRCESYCPVAQFCNQYQEELNGVSRV